MTIDEAIAHCLEVTGKYEVQTEEWCKECAADHRQLAEWLTELKELREENKEAKRLLKVAVEDLKATVSEVYNGNVICKCCKWKSQIGKCICPDNGGCDTDYQWRYADEVLKLIGDESSGI